MSDTTKESTLKRKTMESGHVTLTRPTAQYLCELWYRVDPKMCIVGNHSAKDIDATKDVFEWLSASPKNRADAHCDGNGDECTCVITEECWKGYPDLSTRHPSTCNCQDTSQHEYSKTTITDCVCCYFTFDLATLNKAIDTWAEEFEKERSDEEIELANQDIDDFSEDLFIFLRQQEH